MFLGIILLTGFLGLYIYWFFQTIPSKSEIESKVDPIKEIDSDIFSSDNLEKLEDLNIYGVQPVDISEEYSEKNLFE